MVTKQEIPNAAGLSKREWKFDINNSTGQWTGRLVFEKINGVWSGKMWHDQTNAWENLSKINITASDISFTRPTATQLYTGAISGNKVDGTFTWSGQNWKWTAEELNAPVTKSETSKEIKYKPVNVTASSTYPPDQST